MKNFFKQVLVTALGSMVGLSAFLLAFLIIIPIVVGFMIGGRSSRVEPVVANSILHLRLVGQVVERHRPMDFEIGRSLLVEDRTLGLYEMTKAIEKAKSDKRISGIYLEIGTFDAGWATLSALRRAITEFSESGKWVVAYADRLDEAGYYMASAANQIYLEPYGELELNGLAVQEMFIKGLLDKLDVEPQVFRVGKFKAAIEPLILDRMSRENREQTQVLASDLWSTVRAAASQSTKIEPARIDAMINRLDIVSAESAKAAKIVTDLKFIDEVEEKLKVATVGEDEDLELVTPMRFLRDLNERSKAGKKKIAVIFAEGEIHEGASSRDSIGANDMREDIEAARLDEDVAAIVLRVNSPGGDALASDVIWRELRMTDDEIPVVISMGDTAASGGYYIASAGRFIFAEPTTITGSIGVFGLMFNTQKFFKNKAGVGFDRVVTHEHADIGSMARAVSKSEGEIIQKSVNRVYTRFLDVVQESRGYEKRSDLEAIAEGRVWSGTRAKELGLVDELGGLQQAIAKAAEFAELKDFQIEIYPSDVDPIRHLVERFTGDAMSEIFGVSPKFVRDLKQSLTPKNGVFARLPYDLKIR